MTPPVTFHKIKSFQIRFLTTGTCSYCTEGNLKHCIHKTTVAMMKTYKHLEAIWEGSEMLCYKETKRIQTKRLLVIPPPKIQNKYILYIFLNYAWLKNIKNYWREFKYVTNKQWYYIASLKYSNKHITLTISLKKVSEHLGCKTHCGFLTCCWSHPNI